MKKRWILWVSGAVLLLAAGAAAALFMTNRRDVTTSSEAAYQAYKDGVANENRFYFKEARVSFARALELDPNFAMALLGLARQPGPELEQRLSLIRRAAREKGRLTERERLHVDLLLADFEGRREDMLKVAKELHEKYPNDVRGATILGRDQLLNRNPEQALRIFEELLAVDPNNAEAYNEIGYYYGYRGEYDKAMDKLNKYQFIAPNTANPFDSLAEVQANSGHYNEAIENCNRALAIKPDFAPAFWHLGVAAEGMGEYAKAIEYYEKAAATSDTDDVRREYLGRAIQAALTSGDKEAVKVALARWSQIPPSSKSEDRAIDEGMIAVIGDFAQGKPAEAQRRLVELRPKLEARWEGYHKAGKMAPSVKFYSPEWTYLMAVALEAQGNVDEALKLYEICANPPNNYLNFDQRRWIMEGRAKVAVIVARKGDVDRAEKLIAENRKWNPSWAPCREAEATVAELRRTKVLAATK
jgi:tetratricopeptide (TPR) repeat protein